MKIQKHSHLRGVADKTNEKKTNKNQSEYQQQWKKETKQKTLLGHTFVCKLTGNKKDSNSEKH